VIPQTLHRTVPAVTTDEVEAFWVTAAAVNPGWEMRTYRDPIDPAAFPLTAPHWSRCSHGAQMAGLIRLEAVLQNGGIYIDSDFECYRPFAPLLTLDFFAGWEDANTVPDFIFGARANHPATRWLLDAAIEAIPAGPWASGPGVFTRILPTLPDITLLPPTAFAPYHYSERHRRHEDHKTANPDAYGAHHWAASWLS
jgi:mannosyltransferase OCH1-like enzyme